jgi:uncharacterized protein
VVTVARVLGLFLAGGLSLAQAPKVTPLEPRGYVNDFAGVLSAGAAAGAERLAGEVERKTGAQMSVVTVRNLGGEPIEDYANALARRWGVGKKDNRGVLLLLAITERRTRVDVGYGLESILPDGKVGGILRSVQPATRAGDYDQAVLLTLWQIGNVIAQASGVTLEDPEVQRRPAAVDLPWWVILLGAVAFLWIFSKVGPLMMLGGLPGFGGGRGGGGRGGWDGGGFGGFGGGDFGGGGASSDW